MLTLLHDTHHGAIRVGGTTPQTAIDLRAYLLDNFKVCLERINEDLCILGDLFDTHSVPLPDLLGTYQALNGWLGKGHKLFLVPGNHDLSTDSSKLSSFQFMARLFQGNAQVTYLEKGGWIKEGVYAIPHVPNQDLFDLELSKVPQCDYLLVHANYDNNFAKEADHSLNMSAEQVRNCKAGTIYFAHEHYYREVGKVFIGGNPYPSSISDCLHKDMKCMHRIGFGGIERLQTWDAAEYVELPWDALEDTDAKFVRVVGTARADQAALAAEAVVKARRGLKALVVGSAVKVEGVTVEDLGLEATLEAISAFNVMDELRKILPAKDMQIIEGLK